MAIDHHDNLYIADHYQLGDDYSAHSIRLITMYDGNVTTMAGRSGKLKNVHSGEI